MNIWHDFFSPSSLFHPSPRSYSNQLNNGVLEYVMMFERCALLCHLSVHGVVQVEWSAKNKWHGRTKTAGKSKRERSSEQFHTLLLGQYKTSLQECHRKFVHFLLHLAAILLDKHHSHLLVLSISLKKPSQTGTHHFQPPGSGWGKIPPAISNPLLHVCVRDRYTRYMWMQQRLGISHRASFDTHR